MLDLYVYFFWLFVYVYMCEFLWVVMPSMFGVLVSHSFVSFQGLFCLMPGASMTAAISGFYFIIMVVVCYTGHFSWGMCLGRTYEFVFVWSFLAWIASFFGCWTVEDFPTLLGLRGEGLVGAIYSTWSKVLSVSVRPLSLMLRLLINLSVGHLFMMLWIYFCHIVLMSQCSLVLDTIGLGIMQFILIVIVLYEFFVFFLQSFIFGRLLGVYLEEC